MDIYPTDDTQIRLYGESHGKLMLLETARKRLRKELKCSLAYY